MTNTPDDLRFSTPSKNPQNYQQLLDNIFDRANPISMKQLNQQTLLVKNQDERFVIINLK